MLLIEVLGLELRGQCRQDLFGVLVGVGVFCVWVLLDDVCQGLTQVYLIYDQVLGQHIRGLTDVLYRLLHLTLV